MTEHRPARLIDTRFSRLLGLAAPIVSAPMAMAAGGRLAAAVSEAGGLGFIGGGYGDQAWLEREFEALGAARAGVGFITWKLAENRGLLDMALERGPAAMFLSFGDIAPFAGAIRDAGVPLMAQVQTVDMARDAVRAGADIIVAQGSEAGGHGASRGTMSLVPEVVDAIGADVPVLAAGGIADGRGLAAALMLGADGVVMGTRFWAASEALVSPGLHTAAVHAGGDGTVRTSLPDQARGFDWPGGFTIRTLENAWIRQWQGHKDGPVSPEAQARYATALTAGDADGAPAIVGEGIGLIRGIKPAADIVAQAIAQAREALGRVG